MAAGSSSSARQAQTATPSSDWAEVSRREQSAFSHGFNSMLFRGPQPRPNAGQKATTQGQGQGKGTSTGGSPMTIPSESLKDIQAEAAPKKGKSPVGTKSIAGRGGDTPDGAGGEPEDTAATRKEQNRIAQREFRQRKQEYIRALECRVELLSTDHDTQVDRLRWLLRQLLIENNQLRDALKMMGSFVGDLGAGGFLGSNPEIKEELNELLDSTSEETIAVAWHSWPGKKPSEALRKMRAESDIPLEGLPESADRMVPSKNTRGRRAIGKGNAEPNKAPGRIASGSGTAQSRKRKGRGSTGDEEDCTREGAAKRANQESFSSADRHASRAMNANGASSQGTPTAPFNTASNSNAFVNSVGDLGSTSNAGANWSVGSAVFDDLLPRMGGLGNMEYVPASFAHELGILSAGPRPTTILSSDVLNQSAVAQVTNGTPQQPRERGADMAGQGQPRFNSSLGTNGHATAGPSPSNVQPPSNITLITTGSAATSSDGPPPSVQMRRRLTFLMMRVNKVRRKLGRSDLVDVLFDSALTEDHLSHEDRACLDAIDHLGLDMDISEERSAFEMEQVQQAMFMLIHHMDAFLTNPSYRLPQLLKPSEKQVTIPHDPMIDGMPFPGLRDALIDHQSQVNMDDVMFDTFTMCKLHEGDSLSEQQWELGFPYLYKYRDIIDERTLAVANKHRVARGEEPLSKASLRAMQV